MVRRVSLRRVGVPIHHEMSPGATLLQYCTPRPATCWAFLLEVHMSAFPPTIPDVLLVSRAAQLRWVRILGQLVTMQVLITRDKLHSVGRGKR